MEVENDARKKGVELLLGETVVACARDMEEDLVVENQIVKQEM
jgi:hypothetical protein